MTFSRPEYWSGQPFLSPRDLPNTGIEPRSPALWADSLPAEPPGKTKNTGVGNLSLLQGIFPTKKLNQVLLHRRQILYQLSYRGSPRLPPIPWPLSKSTNFPLIVLIPWSSACRTSWKFSIVFRPVIQWLQLKSLPINKTYAQHVRKHCFLVIFFFGLKCSHEEIQSHLKSVASWAL